MIGRKDAVLLGPFVGELYWEVGRFAPLLPKMINKEYKKKDVTYIVLTRRERFDLYGKYADILVPLNIPNDYITRFPNCFRLDNFSIEQYNQVVKFFYNKYQKRYNILKHIYPDITKKHFLNKNQFHKSRMIFDYKPREENYDIVNNYLSKNKKPLVVISPRFRKGFKRNWNRWEEFYDLIYNDKDLMSLFSFIICGKSDEYIPDPKNRFYDLNEMEVGTNSSLVGLLLVVLERSILVCGSQSAIPNMGLLYKVDVLEFGCQKKLHTVTYNIHNSPIEFIDDKYYKIEPEKLFKVLKKKLMSKKELE